MTDGKKIAWITGGGTGIGFGGAKALSAEGWTVIISGRRAEVLDEAVAELAGNPGKVVGKAVDVSNAADVDRVAAEIVAEYGRIDLLVNSAGLNVPNRSWKDSDNAGWDKVVSINLDGAMYCIRAVLPTMRAQGGGQVINVASWAGRFVGRMTGPAYIASKHALVALTHSLNLEEHPNGIRATALNPGEVATPIMKLRPVMPSVEDQARMLQEDDMGKTIAFIANMPARVCINEILMSPTMNKALG